MHILRKAIRRLIRNIAEKRILAPLTTVKLLHFIETSRWPDIKKPLDLNEKLMREAFFGNTTAWPELTDKYEVRKYVDKAGFPDILTKLTGIYENPEEIDFNQLPDECVIKATNSCGKTIFFNRRKEKDIRKILNQIKGWRAHPFGYATGEIHYLKIPHRIIIEEKIGGTTGILPTDYKFMCFDGKVHSCLVCSERNDTTFESRRNLMDVTTWKEIQDATSPEYRGDASKLQKPKMLDKMVTVASRLSKGFRFVRIDLYESDGKVYFGEMTFTPSGFHITSITRPFLIEMGNLYA